MRTYDSSFVKNSYLNYLSKFGKIDLYIHTWRKRGRSNRHGCPDKNQLEEDYITEKDLIVYYSQFDFFNIKEIAIDDFDVFLENLDDDLKKIYNSPVRTHTPVTIAVPIQYKYQQAALNIKRTGVDYKYCMMLRPDFAFVDDVPMFKHIEDNTIYFRHWHKRCIDHGWFANGSTIINQLEHIYTNLKKNNKEITSANDFNRCNNEIIIRETENKKIKVMQLEKVLSEQICYDYYLLLNKYKFLDGYAYTSVTRSVEIEKKNNDVMFKKIVCDTQPFSWFGYEMEKGTYNLSFNIVSDVDINFSFIKSHNPVIFYKTKLIKANIEESISITLNLVNKTSVVFIFDNYNNFVNISFKNICFIPTKGA
jgi:hypothetical protein